MHTPESVNEQFLSVVYVSTATEPFTRDELAELLEKSRHRNRQVEITGMLLHHDGSFIQAIEGPPAAVRALHHKIVGDPRHTGIITLLEAQIETREFGEWEMAFRDLASLGASERDGYSDFLNSKDLPGHFASDPSRSKKLLLSFKSGLNIN